MHTNYFVKTQLQRDKPPFSKFVCRKFDVRGDAQAYDEEDGKWKFEEV